MLFKFDETNVWRERPSKQRRSCEVKNGMGEMKKMMGEKQNRGMLFRVLFKNPPDFLFQKHQIGQDDGSRCFNNRWDTKGDAGIVPAGDGKIFDGI